MAIAIPTFQRSASILFILVLIFGCSRLTPLPDRDAAGKATYPVWRYDLDGRTRHYESIAELLRQGIARDRLELEAVLKPFTNRLAWPISRNGANSGFKMRAGRFHYGIDIRAPIGSLIQAAHNGRVNVRRNAGNYGHLVEVFGKGIATRYAHLDRIAVTQGAIIKAGDVLGTVGMTGNSTGPHLHFETLVPIRKTYHRVDPMFFYSARSFYR